MFMIHEPKHHAAYVMVYKADITRHMDIVSKADQMRFSTKVPGLEIAMLTLCFEVVMFLQKLSSAVPPPTQNCA